MALKTSLTKYHETAEVELDDMETGRPGDYYVTLLGPTHPDRRAIEQRNADAQSFKLGKKGQIDTIMSAGQREKQRHEWLCACIAAWRNVLGPDDKPLPCTDENKLSLLRAYPSLADQIATELGEHANFLRSAAKG